MKLRNNKKGGMFDLILAIALSLILVVCLIIFTFAQNKVDEKMVELAPTIQKSFTNETNVSMIINDTIGKTTDAFKSFKWISLTLIFGFFMSILISAFLVRTHPAFFVGYIFVVIISIVISVYVSNSYEELMNTPILTETILTGFWGASWIFLNLPIWVTIIGMIAGILMYINIDVGSYYG
jgi:hypothetical protein